MASVWHNCITITVQIPSLCRLAPSELEVYTGELSLTKGECQIEVPCLYHSCMEMLGSIQGLGVPVHAFP
jgi:hypothetical protein